MRNAALALESWTNVHSHVDLDQIRAPRLRLNNCKTTNDPSTAIYARRR